MQTGAPHSTIGVLPTLSFTQECDLTDLKAINNTSVEVNLRKHLQKYFPTDSKLSRWTFRAETPLRQVQNQAADSLLHPLSLQNTTEKELVCRASTVLRRFYSPHEISPCLKNNSSVLNELRKLLRAISGLNAPVSGAGTASKGLGTVRPALKSMWTGAPALAECSRGVVRREEQQHKAQL